MTDNLQAVDNFLDSHGITFLLSSPSNSGPKWSSYRSKLMSLDSYTVVTGEPAGAVNRFQETKMMTCLVEVFYFLCHQRYNGSFVLGLSFIFSLESRSWEQIDDERSPRKLLWSSGWCILSLTAMPSSSHLSVTGMRFPVQTKFTNDCGIMMRHKIGDMPRDKFLISDGIGRIGSPPTGKHS